MEERREELMRWKEDMERIKGAKEEEEEGRRKERM